MSEALAAKMAELSARFAAQAGVTRERLAAQREDRAAIVAEAHKLAGIAAMFGQPAIGVAALALEERAESGGDYGEEWRQLDALLAELAA
ncbi:Hpt domain-containing protein [Aurantiacibacter luteus]|uniref:HPt domain-containing protein n=1 Tax=Aurantiacibacter luteus TaxID=1581420 RepID=A0A0G9MV57_9SPHN|nr:Hpt domain-containing protein [Aurantiacibacter luteus]KLE34610.1 hypothetical protein AAW00_10495 [Aurantiacibacter luteus]